MKYSVALASSFAATVLAACDCSAYQATLPDGSKAFFTQKIESDFLKTPDIHTNPDWNVQDWKGSNGNPYTREVSRDNVMAGDAQNPGVHFKVTGIPASELTKGQYVVGAEAQTARSDISYGSFRAGMKLTPVPGTCASTFFYLNDTNEVDIEFLSAEYTDSQFPIHFTVQNEEGPGNYGENNYAVKPMSIDPTDGFHDYRIDMLPGKAIFYIDGKHTKTLATPDVPDVPGYIILNHWSDGGENWSQGPPTEDAVVTWSYTNFYFNSSTAENAQDKSCSNICQLGDVAGVVTGKSASDDGEEEESVTPSATATANQQPSGTSTEGTETPSSTGTSSDRDEEETGEDDEEEEESSSFVKVPKPSNTNEPERYARRKNRRNQKDIRRRHHD